MSSDLGGWDQTDFEQALQKLRDVGVIDAHGKTITSEELERVIAAARQYGGGHPVLSPNFREATFEGAAHFDDATFKGDADFSQAVFDGAAHFKGARFKGEAHFEEATFKHETHFSEAKFDRPAWFRDAVFLGYAHFPKARFEDRAEFLGADLKGGLRLGPSLVRGGLVLDNASLADVDLRVSTRLLSCQGTRFHGPAHLKVRWAEINLEETVFDRISTLAFLPSLEGTDDTTLARCGEFEHEAPGRRRRTTRERASGMPCWTLSLGPMLGT